MTTEDKTKGPARPSTVTEPKYIGDHAQVESTQTEPPPW